MDFVRKLKETLISVLPIVALVLILHWTIAPLGSSVYYFIQGSILLVLGLTLFLAGTEIGMVPVGEKLGSVIAHKASLPILLVVGFVIGFGVTYAEPDVNVLALQIHSINPLIDEKILVLAIAVGLGIFVDIGLLRIFKDIPLRNILVVFYVLDFILIPFIGQNLASVSFDASGSTTGPLAVPFILALGLGVSGATRNGNKNSFGLTGIASIGPVLAVAVLALLSGNAAPSNGIARQTEEISTIGTVFLTMLKKTATGFCPLAVLIVILQFSVLKFPRVKFRKICLGIIYSFIGIVVFLSGVEFGFAGVGKQLGQIISSRYPWWCEVCIGLILGAIVVFAEPAVWILTQQIEEVSAGRIKKSLVMVFLCIGVSIAVGLSVVRSLLNINYLVFIYAGVGISLVLTFFSPQLFTGIAFDSGGVASGPMSTSFILPFAIGISNSADTAFGVIGLIAIAPLISLQILGVIFRIKEAKQKEV